MRTSWWSSNSTSTTYRADIDGLRAIAISCVVIGHAELQMSGHQLFEGGFIGVDVFFVISGFLITRVLIRDICRPDSDFSVANFLLRRVRRLLPALSFMTLSTLLAGWFLLLPRDFAALGDSASCLALFSSNFYFWKSAGYFTAETITLPLLHTWSLALEEQFYFLWPLVVLWILRSREPRFAAGVTTAVFTVSFLISAYGSHRHPSAAFYFLPSRAWEFAAGALTAVVPFPRRYIPRFAALALPATGVASILLSAVILDRDSVFPGLNALVPTLGAALVTWNHDVDNRWFSVSRWLSVAPLVFLGRISYSLYLWHWPLFAFAGYHAVEPLSLYERLGIVVMSVVLAALSWKFVEEPFRRGRLIASPVRTASFAVAVTTFTVAVGQYVATSRGFPDRLPDEVLKYANNAFVNPVWRPQLTPLDIPENLAKYGDVNQAPRLLVWGDSHAMAVLPAVDSLCRQKRIAAVAATHSATPPLIDFLPKNNAGLAEETPAFSNAVVDYIRNSQIQTVVLIACWDIYREPSSEEFRTSLLKTVDLLQNEGLDVFLMIQTPRFRIDVCRWVSVQKWNYPQLPTARLQQLKISSPLPNETLQLLINRAVRILDPEKAFIAVSHDSIFSTYDADGSFYRDDDHLSTYGALKIQSLFSECVESAARGL